jgi:hypothetical protein
MSRILSLAAALELAVTAALGLVSLQANPSAESDANYAALLVGHLGLNHDGRLARFQDRCRTLNYSVEHGPNSIVVVASPSSSTVNAANPIVVSASAAIDPPCR